MLQEKKVDSIFLLLYLISLCLTSLWATQLNAHEMWIEPIKYQVNKNDTIYAHEKVGEDFKGNQYSYLNTSYEKLELTVNNKTRSVKSRIGDMPAIHERAKEEGLTILSAVTTVSDVKYKKWEKFENFIKSKKLDWVLKKHKKRGLPENNIIEAYRRFSKAFVKVGEGKGADKLLGMRLEWLIETNPYDASQIIDTGAVKARLLWEGKPYKHAHVTVFNKIENKMIQTDLLTNKNGVVNIPIKKGGEFLINAVQMLEPSAKIKKETGAVWESLWASITYNIQIAE